MTKLLRKTQQPSAYPANLIHDTYSEGSTDTYSCDYINKELNKTSINFETNEVQTGTLFGKPRYVKVVEIDAPKTTNWTQFSFETLGLENIDYLRILWIEQDRGNGIQENLYSSGGRVQILNTTNKVSFMMDINNVEKLKICFEYNKITD